MALTRTGEHTWTIDTLRDYVEYLQSRHDDLILFRGQSEDKPLVPKIGRVKFRNSAPLPGHEREMFTAFKREAVSFMERVPPNDWDWLAVAQHHGLPTRLLDWTKNPMAALWFCVCVPCSSELPGVVWVFTPTPFEIIVAADQAVSPFDMWKTVVFAPPHVSPRIRAQDAMFTLHPYTEGSFAAFEAEELSRGHLDKIEIRHELFEQIRFDLDRCGIHASALFPDLSGLAQRIEWQNTLAADEHGVANG